MILFEGALDKNPVHSYIVSCRSKLGSDFPSTVKICPAILYFSFVGFMSGGRVKFLYPFSIITSCTTLLKHFSSLFSYIHWIYHINVPFSELDLRQAYTTAIVL